MHIAICDDEQVFRHRIRDELINYSSDHGYTFIIHEFTDGSELLYSKLSFDVIFLDYQMRDINGIDTVDSLRKRDDNTTVIFVSSYPEIVFESMKYRTFPFLIKPLEKEKLVEAVDAIIKEKQNLVHIVVKDEANQKNISVPANEIIYAQAENVYTSIVTEKGSYIYVHNISKLEDELCDGFFFRTNRSYIVNVNYVVSYSVKEIILINGHKALISKSKYKNFKQAYLTYLKSRSVG